MRILVTGGAGFIGSNLILHWVREHSADRILNLDKISYAADPSFLRSLEGTDRYSLVKVDLVDRAAVRKTIRDFKPEGVIHLAAESHVDNSIADPEAFVLSNVVGTFNLLEECRQFWKDSEKSPSRPRFLHVSTDEVFGTLGKDGAFTEQSAYAPNSPYSATKAGSDHLVRAYHHTYGMNTVITNCSNNFGPHQHREKLIPTVITTALAGKPIPIYGRGENVRDWLYVGDHCRALERVFLSGKSGETYNIGSRNEWKNLDLVREICSLLNELRPKGSDYCDQITFVTDRLGHDFRYAIDPTKIENELQWRPEADFRTRLKTTIQWYLEHLS